MMNSLPGVPVNYQPSGDRSEMNPIMASSMYDSPQQIVADLARAKEQPARQLAAPGASSEALKPVPRTVSAGEPSVSQVQKQEQDAALAQVLKSQDAEQSRYADLLNRFKEAQERQRIAQLGVGLTQAAERIGSAIAMTKPGDQSVYQQAMKQAAGITDEFKEEAAVAKEAEKNDPNSPESKSARALLKQQGINVPDNISAAFIEKQYPQFANILNRREAAKERAEIRKERAEDRSFSREQLLSEKDTKDFTKLSEKLTAELASSRSAFGKGANIIRSAEAIETLVSQMDPKDINTRQIQELARGLDAMLSQGAATISGTKKLVPESYSADWAKIAEYITSKPKGAGQEAFVKQMMETVEREKQTARKQMQQTQNKILSGYEHLKERYPERYKRMLGEFGVEPQTSLSGSEKQKVMVEKNGKQYRLPKDQLDEALKQGYKEIK
jgi:hypothetical protein